MQRIDDENIYKFFSVFLDTEYLCNFFWYINDDLT